MSNIYIKSIEFKDLEKFSNERSLHYNPVEEGDKEEEEEFKYSFKDLEPYLKMLPKKEYDLIYLYFILKKEQKEIAKILRLTQGGVSHRISRAKARLKFLVKIPKFTKSEMLLDLKEFFEELDLKILWGLYETTCQSVVAKQVNMTQSRIRHRFMKNIDILEKLKGNEKIKKYFDAFKMISTNNFNILREIKLPKWNHKNVDYIT